MRRLSAPLAVFAFACATRAWAFQQFQSTDYARTDQMIPMRDGVKLFTVILAPKKSTLPLPFYFNRTPYGVSDVQPQNLGGTLMRDGMIFVFQDIRGRYKSEGTFEMMRPTHFNSKAKVDEGTDAFDTIDWLVKNVPNNNGRAAILGGSYDGWTALQAAIQPHPALKLAIPQASPIDMWMNDDFHRYGAFRFSYGLEYSYLMETSKENQPFDLMSPGQDAFDFYLNIGPLSNVDANYLHGKLPTWNAFAKHPNHDSYWSSQSVANILARGPKIPTISVGGYWDQEDPWGPQETYRLFAKHDPHHFNHIVLGPWIHGGWEGKGASLGAIQFGSETSTYYKQHILYPSLLYYLKDRPMTALPVATIFVTGSNEWKSYDQWPPKQERAANSLPFMKGERVQPTVPLYLNINHTLTFEAPDQMQVPYDTYTSDPANPVPYRKRPIEATYDPKGSGWYTWQAQDQRFVQPRPDVVNYETPPLTSDLDVIGNLSATLFAATSGTDSDWVVKLIDEYPSTDANLPGYELPINMEICRARFRNGGKPEAVVPEDPVSYHIDMHAIAHRFLKGHRIMVQVQSSWFPLIDRNPQTFVPNIFLATHDDFQKATQKIYHWADYSSRIELPIAK